MRITDVRNRDKFVILKQNEQQYLPRKVLLPFIPFFLGDYEPRIKTIAEQRGAEGALSPDRDEKSAIFPIQTHLNYFILVAWQLCEGASAAPGKNRTFS